MLLLFIVLVLFVLLFNKTPPPCVAFSYSVVGPQVCLALWSFMDNLTTFTTPNWLPPPPQDPTLWRCQSPSTGRSAPLLRAFVFAYLPCQDGNDLIIQLLCVCMQYFVWNVRLCVWQVGDEIVISTTSYSAWETEKRLLTAVSGDGLVLNLNQPLNYTHVGQFCLLNDSSHKIIFSF